MVRKIDRLTDGLDFSALKRGWAKILPVVAPAVDGFGVFGRIPDGGDCFSASHSAFVAVFLCGMAHGPAQWSVDPESLVVSFEPAWHPEDERSH